MDFPGSQEQLTIRGQKFSGGTRRAPRTVGLSAYRDNSVEGVSLEDSDGGATGTSQASGTTIKFELRTSTVVGLSVCDMLGLEVSVLANESPLIMGMTLRTTLRMPCDRQTRGLQMFWSISSLPAGKR
jgi:hypothetical protein